MARRNSIATLLVMLMISAGLSGCFGEDSEEVRKGIPSGLTLACLSDDKYTSMVVEIDYESGYMPEQSSTDLLKTRLEQVCNKPQGIEILLTQTNFEHEGQWSSNDVREKGWSEKSSNPQSGSTLYWQAIFPSGQYANDGVLGVAVDASTVAIFGEAVDDAEGPIFNRPSAEEIENILHLL